MRKIEEVFKNRKKALIGYVTVGYPDIKATPEIVRAMAESGCDIVELGIPFSDPLADGATIQNASFKALQNGVTPRRCVEIAGEISHNMSIPLAFMTYYNPIFNYGLEGFCRDSVRSGISGLIVPDLPPEEADELERLTKRHGIDLIYLLAPNSPADRVKLAARRSRGFVYLVSLAGVTGARDTLPPGLEEFAGRVREKTAKPLCVGFGIAGAEQARRAAAVADGVIVGSRIIQLIEDDRSLNKLKGFISELREALDEEKNNRR